MTLDIKDFYLGTPLDTLEYMWVPVQHLPPSTIQTHNLGNLIDKGRILVEIHKGIYGLCQAGLLAQRRLIAHLAEHGYHQAPNTLCFFKHKTRRITFGLVVDDFGVKYHDEQDVHHLISCLEQLYELRVDWEGTKFVGFTIAHDRTNKTLTLSMPDYITNALRRFNIDPNAAADTPYEHEPVYHRGAQGQHFVVFVSWARRHIYQAIQTCDTQQGYS